MKFVFFFYVLMNVGVQASVTEVFNGSKLLSSILKLNTERIINKGATVYKLNNGSQLLKFVFQIMEINIEVLSAFNESVQRKK